MLFLMILYRYNNGMEEWLQNSPFFFFWFYLLIRQLSIITCQKEF